MTNEPHDDPAERPTEVPASESIGHFRLIETIGEGANATVHLAVDRDIPGRRVALKVLKPEGFAADLASLRHEASVLAALQHPNILVVHEIGESARGPWLAMEHLRGGSLADRLRDGPLAMGEGLRLARQAADALRAAHEKGILHRDVKPPNLLFSESGEIKVADFGLASRQRREGVVEAEADREAGAAEAATAEAFSDYEPPLIAGTPGYIGPEVLRGDGLMQASDQYAWGVTLHQMLSGEHPFQWAHWQQILAGREPRLDPRLPADVGALIARCLRSDPGERFASMRDLLAELDRVIARRDPVRRRLRRAQAGVVAVALVLLGGVYGHRRYRGWQARRLNEAGMVAYEAGRLEEAWRKWDKARLVDPANEAACQNLGMHSAASGDAEGAVRVLERCAEDFPGSARILLGLGRSLRDRGSPEQAARVLRDALGKGPPADAEPDIVNELALALREGGSPGEAISLLQGRERPADDTEAGAVLNKTLGLALLDAGRAAEAAAVFRRAVEGPLQEGARGIALIGLGRALEATGDPRGAMKAFSRAGLSGDEDVRAAARAGLERVGEQVPPPGSP